MGEAQPSEQHNEKNVWNQPKKIISWVDNDALAPRPAQDHKCVEYKSNDKSKMMLENERLCKFFEIFSLSWFAPFSTNSSNGSMHHVAIGEKNLHINLKWA